MTWHNPIAVGLFSLCFALALVMACAGVTLVIAARRGGPDDET